MLGGEVNAEEAGLAIEIAGVEPEVVVAAKEGGEGEGGS